MFTSFDDQNDQQSDLSTVDIRIHKPIQDNNSLYDTVLLNFQFTVGMMTSCRKFFGKRHSNSWRLTSSLDVLTGRMRTAGLFGQFTSFLKHTPSCPHSVEMIEGVSIVVGMFSGASWLSSCTSTTPDKATTKSDNQP